MKPQTLLRTMWIGSALMIALIIGAGYFGYEQSEAVRGTAKALIREHLVDSQRGKQLEARIETETADLLDELMWLVVACVLLAAGGAAATVWTTRRLLQKLERQSDELQRVSWHMVGGQEKMSQRFSHELNDELGQALVSLRGMLLRSPDPDCAPLIAGLDEVIRDMRELSQILRPVILDDFGLDAALKWLCYRFEQRTGITISYRSNTQQRFYDEAETHLFRVAQEALTNVARHSLGTEAQVRLEAARNQIVLTVADNGVGIAPGVGERTTSLGMTGMRARLRQVGGTLTVANRAEGGLMVRAAAPVAREESDPADVAVSRAGM